MNSSFTFEGEPFSGYLGMPHSLEADEAEQSETNPLAVNPELAGELGSVDEDGRIIDLTAAANKSRRQGTRDPKKVYALVLHQMACCFKRSDPLKSYLNTGAHFAILQDGRILQLHPVSAMVWASNCTSPRSVAVEFAGNFPDTRGRWWFNCVKDPKTGDYEEIDNKKCCQYLGNHRDQKGCDYLQGKRNQVTQAQIEAGRYLVRYLVRTMGLKTILAHRQSSSSRENDPGPDIWYHVGQWAVDNLGLSDGGPGFKCGTGNPIPDAWRSWGRISGGIGGTGAEKQHEANFANEFNELNTEGDFCPTCRHEREQLMETGWQGETLAAPQAACADYAPGEVQKSRTAQGHLASDVNVHPRGLLIADFGVDWRTPPDSTRRDKALRDWLTTILQVIKANPTTTIRILGFSDCVGKERHNTFLRRGRAFKVCALLREMLGGGAQWNSFKSRVVFLDGAPITEYIASNATIEGRAKNRSVLIENVRTVNFDPQVVKACLITPKQAANYPLLGVIPNVPDYQKYVPIDYKLNAKKMVGELAQDVSSGRHTIHKWLDGVHLGIAGFEIFTEGVLLVELFAIASPLLGMVANFMALGMGCADAAEIVATNWSATGYSRGVVMGANERPASMVKDYFANDYFPPNPICPAARDVAIANYKMGLLVGYVHGRSLCPNQRVIFFKDLGRRMGDMSYLGDPKTWGRKQRMEWYVTAAAIFRKHHLL